MLSVSQNLWNRIRPQREFDPELNLSPLQSKERRQANARFMSIASAAFAVIYIGVVTFTLSISITSSSLIVAIALLTCIVWFALSYREAKRLDIFRSVLWFMLGTAQSVAITSPFFSIEPLSNSGAFYVNLAAIIFFVEDRHLVKTILLNILTWFITIGCNLLIKNLSIVSLDVSAVSNYALFSISFAVFIFTVPYILLWQLISVLRKLMGVFSLLLLSLYVIVAIFSQNYAHQTVTNQTREELNTLAQSQSAIVKDWIEAQFETLRAAAQSGNLEQAKTLLGNTVTLSQQPDGAERGDEISLTEENRVRVSVPLAAIGRLEATYPLEAITNLLSGSELGETGEVNIYIPQASVLLSTNGVVVVTAEQAAEIESITQVGEFSFMGDTSIGGKLKLEGSDWQILAHQHVSEINAPAEAQAERIRLLLGITVGLFWLTLVWFSQIITRPVNNLADVAQKVREGDYQAVATVEGTDEIGLLTGAFNRMTRTLRENVEGLEERVNERTRDLQVATQVSKQITQELRLEELLPKLVENTKEGFGLYFCSVYLYEEEKKQLVLSAGTGEAGVQMKAEGKVYEIEARPSIVAQAGREKQAVVIGDVRRSNIYSPNRFLPETRSEAAIPMVAQGELVGVLGVQSVEVDGFGEENLQILTSLAEQIGVAVRNAQLYEEQVHVADELKRVDEMKSQFLSSMSHELRTPLNAIINFVEMVATGLIGPVSEEQADLLNHSLNSSKHLLHLINDVLDISKIQAGKLTLFIEENVDLKEEIDGVVTMVSGMQRERPEVRFVQEIDLDLQKVSCDRRRVRQVLLNLLTNAFKFTEKGSVTLRARNMRDTVEIAVLDTGAGISAEMQERIFEPFEQTADGVKQVEGTGLGLPISKSLVEMHGGKLWVKSTPSEGAAFFFFLPMRARVDGRE